MVELLFHLLDVAIQHRDVITFLIQLIFQLRATLFQLLQANYSCSIAAPQQGLHTNDIGPMLGIEPGV